MRLSEFISQNRSSILAEWELFARSNEPAASNMDTRALRDHAAQMLQAFALDLATSQTARQAHDKAQARAPLPSEETAATIHGEARLLSGFTIDQLIAEYRALRASVLRLWINHEQATGANDVDGTNVGTNVTDIMRFNEAVDQAVAESVSRFSRMVNHSQNLFLAILGHDLRNPLNTTVVASRVLMEAPSIDPAHGEMAAKIHRSGQRMSKLVDDLIDYTRTHLGSSLPMAVKETDLAALANATADELRMVQPGRIISVEAQGAVLGHWDEGRMAQVFSNLIGNALQHSNTETPITVRVAAREAQAHVSVHNFGEPIDPQSIGMIFDPLVRLGANPHQPGNPDTSLGIGLYIARAIVEAHGGAIAASSQADAGTTFYFTLPIDPELVRRQNSPSAV